MLRADRLLIRPGTKMAAPSGSVLELTLAEGSGIVSRAGGGGDLAGVASGTVTVNFTHAAAVRGPKTSTCNRYPECFLYLMEF